jgi:hypothetical protein
VKAINGPLPDADGFPGAEIEVYDAGRYSAMTGAHIVGTPAETRKCQAFLNGLAEEFVTVAEGTPDELTREPELTKAELADVDTTDDIQGVLNAIQHTGPSDIQLRSTVTEERADRSKSLDPSWASSKSGTRLAQVDDGWVYRDGYVGLDALQVVALEEGIIRRENEYPSGEAFWRAVEALRERGAHIPEYEAPSDDVDHVAVLPEDDSLTESTSGWDWRHAGQRQTDTDPLAEARKRTVDTIADAIERRDQVLVEALPTLGKSYGTIAAAARTNEPITVRTTRGHKEQYEQIREWCDEHDLSTYTLPSFTRDCGTANGEHGEDWKRQVRDWLPSRGDAEGHPQERRVRTRPAAPVSGTRSLYPEQPIPYVTGASLERPWIFTVVVVLAWVLLWVGVEVLLFDDDLLAAVMAGVAGGLAFVLITIVLRRQTDA